MSFKDFKSYDYNMELTRNCIENSLQALTYTLPNVFKVETWDFSDIGYVQAKVDDLTGQVSQLVLHVASPCKFT